MNWDGFKMACAPFVGTAVFVTPIFVGVAVGGWLGVCLCVLPFVALFFLFWMMFS